MRENFKLAAHQKWVFGVGCLLTFLTLFSPSAFADTWSFVVAGDGRTDPSQASSRDPSGINTPVLKKLLHSIAEKKPRFMLYTGDLIYGRHPELPKVAEQLKKWKEIARAEAPNLAILPVRGNHETSGDNDGKAWLDLIKPILDANKVVYFPGDEEGFSYTYSAPDHPQTVVIAVDQYLPTHSHEVNLGELEKSLQQARSNNAVHIFVFSHEMAFTCACHCDSENMAHDPDQRNKFVNLLQKYGCDYFFAGHDHTYDWMQITSTNWPANYTLNQIVAGTAGAPFYQDKGYRGDRAGFELKRKEHKQETYGYLLVTVDDSLNGKVDVKFETVAPPTEPRPAGGHCCD